MGLFHHDQQYRFHSIFACHQITSCRKKTNLDTESLNDLDLFFSAVESFDDFDKDLFSKANESYKIKHSQNYRSHNELRKLVSVCFGSLDFSIRESAVNQLFDSFISDPNIVLTSDPNWVINIVEVIPNKFNLVLLFL
jgi:hypothetical protein